MFMLMDDIGVLCWQFGKRLIVSHAESEPAKDGLSGDRKKPPGIVHSPAAE
jgi:hypothetical protein